MSETTNKPILMLDIDGVLNLFDAWEKDGYDFSGRQPKVKYLAPKHLSTKVALGYKLLLHPEHPEMLRQLEERFDIVWATMWQGNSYDFADVAGFGHKWDYIDFDSFYTADERLNHMRGKGVGPYKQPGIEFIAGDEPAVWVDDDMTRAQHEWARQRDAAGFPTLFIQPDPEFGLTWEHVNELLSFADRVDADRLAA
jgi:hypothetical protein